MKKINILIIVSVLMFTLILTSCDDAFEQTDKSLPTDENAGFVTVTNVDELIAAIKPEAKILLKAGNYELSSAESYGAQDGDYFKWCDTYDGYEFIISGADGLILKGEEDDKVKITARSSYASVLTVEDSGNITLQNLTLGHIAKPGTCSGDVLTLNSVTDGRIEDCRLYGCGVVGIDALKCKRLDIEKCEIYDCSSIAVNANQSIDIRVIDCDIHDCGEGYGGSVFWATGTTGFAVVDCDIERNNGNYFLYASYCPETYVLGCETEENTFHDSVFWLAGNAPKLEGTSLHDNVFTAWYDSSYSPTPGLRCTDRAGNELTNAQLENMQETECIFDGPVIPEITASPETVMNSDGTRTVYVKTADELIAAIAPDTDIVLSSDEIMLSDASDYGSGLGEYYHWESGYDGPQLVIENCDNLSITSEIVTHIIAEPRYANVFTFENCGNVRLGGFKAGHTEAANSCTGGVIYMNECKNMSVEGALLYGCGVYGVCADFVKGLSITDCEIYDCTQGGIYLYEVNNAVIENCDIHDCAIPEISVFDCSGVSFVGSLGEGRYLSDGLYKMVADGMPEVWNWESEPEYIEPSLDLPYIDIQIGNALTNTLFLGEGDEGVELSAYVFVPNAEGINTNQICWICEDENALKLDRYVGQNVTVTSALKPGQKSELYIYYLENGSVTVSASVSVFGSRP